MKKEIHSTTIITADDGKVFADKGGKILSKVIYLGSLDSHENYVEVDEPKKETI